MKSYEHEIKIIGDLLNEGLNPTVLLTFVPRYSSMEDHDMRVDRLRTMNAPNLVSIAINLKTNIATSLFGINKIDTKLFKEMLTSCFAYGGFYIAQQDMLVQPDYTPIVSDSIVSRAQEKERVDLILTPYHIQNSRLYNKIEIKNYRMLVTYGDTIPRPPFSKFITSLGAYYNLASTLSTSLNISSFPILVRSGSVAIEDDKRVYISPLSIIELRMADADAHWLEHSGRMHEILSANLDKIRTSLEDEMGVTWLKQLLEVTDKTATSATIRSDFALSEIEGIVYMIAKFLSDVYGDEDYYVLDFTETKLPNNAPKPVKTDPNSSKKNEQGLPKSVANKTSSKGKKNEPKQSTSASDESSI